jgi:hypothetical protein
MRPATPTAAVRMFDPRTSKDVLGKPIQLEGKVEGSFSTSLNKTFKFQYVALLLESSPGHRMANGLAFPAKGDRQSNITKDFSRPPRRLTAAQSRWAFIGGSSNSGSNIVT